MFMYVGRRKPGNLFLLLSRSDSLRFYYQSIDIVPEDESLLCLLVDDLRHSRSASSTTGHLSEGLILLQVDD